MVRGLHRQAHSREQAPGSRGRGSRVAGLFFAGLLLGLLFTLSATASAQSVDDVRLGGVEPGDCLVLEAAPDALTSNVPEDELPSTEETQQDPAKALVEEALDPTSVPIVCQEPMNETMRQLVREGSRFVEQTRELRDAVNGSLSAIPKAAEIPFLYENFQEDRVGGLGNWTVETAGDSPGFVEPQGEPMGDGFALTRSPGETYPHGMDTALVSPGIDLGGTVLQPSMATLPERVEALGEQQLREQPPGAPAEEGSQVDICLSGSDSGCIVEDAADAGGRQAYQILRQAYLDTARSLLEEWRNQQPKVTLELRHRFNLADELDGVTYEVLTEPPSASAGVPDGTPIEPIAADPANHQETAASGGDAAFTGNSSGWTTHRFDLTKWAGQRIWIQARAQTVPSFFAQTVENRLEEGEFTGYAVDGAFVNATVAPRNLRVLQIDAGQIQVDGNWTLAPPLGDHRATVAVANQGTNATNADVRLEACTPSFCRTEATWSDVNLPAGDVRELDARLLSVPSDQVTLRATIQDTDEVDQRAEVSPEDNERRQRIDLEAIQRLKVHADADNRRGLTVEPLQGSAEDPRTVRVRLQNTGNLPITRDVELVAQDTADGQAVPTAVEDPGRRLDLEPGESTSFKWRVRLPSDGVYRLSVQGLGSSAELVGPQPAALAYADRSPGVVCADDTHRQRACGQAWRSIVDLPRVDQDERRDADEIRSALVTPDGVPLALTDDGELLAFENAEWTTRASASVDWLVSDGEVPLAVSEDGVAYTVTGSGLGSPMQMGLEEVHALAVHQETGILALGEGSDVPLAVSSWTGSGWSRLVELDRDEDAIPADLTVGDDGTVALASLEPNGTDAEGEAIYDVVLCTFSTAGAVDCPEIDEPEDRLPLPEAQRVDQRAPSVQLGTAGSSLVALVEAPVPQGEASPCSEAERSGAACLLRLPGLTGTEGLERPADRRLIDPGTVPEEGLAVSFVDRGSQTWVRNASVTEPERLRRLSHSPTDGGLRTVGLPASGEISGLGGGPTTTAAVAGTELVASVGDSVELQPGNDWHPHARLLPQTGDRVITTVVPQGVGTGADASSTSGPKEDVYLRASCGDAGLAKLVHTVRTVERFANANTSYDNVADAACLEIDPFPLQIDDPRTQDTESYATSQAEKVDYDDKLQLDARYNLKKVGSAEPEIRLVLQPTQKLGVETGLSTAAVKNVEDLSRVLDPEASLVSTGPLGDVYRAMEQETNSLLGCLTERPAPSTTCDVSAMKDNLGLGIKGEVDEGDRVEVPDRSVRSPHVVAVHELEPTGADWRTIEVDVSEELKERGLDRYSWRLLGLEFAFPQGTQMALDAAWMNRTSPGDHEVLLFTNGAEAEGTWKRAVMPNRQSSYLGGLAGDIDPQVDIACLQKIQDYGDDVQDHVGFEPGESAIGTILNAVVYLRDFDPEDLTPPPDPPPAGGWADSCGAPDVSLDTVPDPPPKDVRHRKKGFPVVHETAYSSWFDDGAEQLHTDITPTERQPGTPSWHLSEVTSKPAWTFMAPDNESTVEEPVHDRLVTPAIDLRNAERPELAFRHAYAFTVDSVAPDSEGMGWIEAQVETEPGEWSHWFRLRPDGGYTGPTSIPAFHGANVETDRNGTYRTALDASNWEEVTVDLVDQQRTLDGHRVRFAFNALFRDNVDDTNPEHEGWAVSDLRVRSQRPVVDLAAEDPHIDEAYNATRTGLPPGDTVDVNVTIRNEGDHETGPRRLSWELVGVGDRQQVLDRGALPIASLAQDQRTWSRFSLPVPTLDELRPLGIDENSGGVYVRISLDQASGVDEDPTDDLVELGSPTEPFPVRTTPELDLRVEVAPPTGPVDRTRTVQTILNNTGNVPISDVTVERNADALLGSRSQRLPGAFSEITAKRELSAGEEKTVSSLAPGSGIEDVLWDPPQAGTYLIQAVARADETTARGQAQVVASEAALFNSVENPVRGQAAEGDFQLDEGWSARSPGAFGSAEAYHLDVRDLSIGPEGRNVSLSFPTVDLTNYRRAELSFLHDYEFERAFDGGAVQASVDGGETWRSLEPITSKDTDDQGDERTGFDASSPHDGFGPVLGGGNPMAAGNLSIPAFTGTPATEGWTSTRFDLSQLEELREPGEVAKHRFEEMEGNSSLELPPPAAENPPERVYSHPSWSLGVDSPLEGVLVENRTKLHSPQEDVLYTGTVEDQREEGANVLVRYEIPLPDFDDPTEEAQLVWEEWGPLAGQQDTGTELGGSPPVVPFARGVRHEDTWTSSDYRSGCADPTLQPTLLSVDGKTRRYMVDVTDQAQDDTVDTVYLSFMVHGWSYTATGQPQWRLEGVNGFTEDHPGFAVTDIQLETFQRSPAGPVGVEAEEVSLASASRQVLPPGNFTFDSNTASSPDRPLQYECPPSSGGGGVGSDGVFRTTDETAAVETPWFAVELGDNEEERDDAETNTVLSAAEPRDHSTGTVWDPPENGDTRLVLPPLDLASGNNVRLEFDHVPAFSIEGGACPQEGVGGGVVEASVWDPAENEWGEWQQIYSQPDAMGPEEAGGYDAGNPVRGHVLGPLDPPSDPGCMTTFPFELHEEEQDTTAAMRPYLYNTCLKEFGKQGGQHCSGLTGEGAVETVRNWRNATFDLTQFRGDRVRLAFHAFFQPYCDYEEVFEPGDGWSGDAETGIPGAQPRPDFHRGCPVDGARWLIDNVTVRGEAFSGQPVELRFQAGVDGSIHNATWSIDDVGIVGERYDKNVGLYVNETPDTVAPGQKVTLEGELRNMGQQLRRDLVVRAELLDAPGQLGIQLGNNTLSGGASRVTSDPVTLDAGERTSVELELTAGTGLSLDDEPRIKLEVLRLSELLGTPGRPEGEAVTTNLERIVELEPREEGISVGEAKAQPKRVPADGSATVHLPITNPVPDAVRLEVTCTVSRVQTWLPVDHSTQNHGEPVTTSEGSCSLIDDSTFTLSAAETEIRSRADVPRDGVYRVGFDVRDVTNGRDLGEPSTLLWAGDEPRFLFEDFTHEGQPSASGWSSGVRPTGEGSYEGSSQAASATDEASRRGNGSVLMGITRDQYEQGRTYPTEQATRLVSPAVDLHNVTDENVTLTFYHMARFAYGDGADVKIRVTENEQEGGWSSWCKLHPRADYDGFVVSYLGPTDSAEAGGGGESNARLPGGGGVPTAHGPERKQTSDDLNPAHEDPQGVGLSSKHGFFGSHENDRGQEVARWDESWQLAAFPLTEEHIECQSGEGIDELGGHSAQFAFTLYAGEADDDPPEDAGADPDPLDRGRGQGWFLDSVVVSTGQANQTPARATIPLLDAAPKRLPVQLDNRGPLTEHVEFRLDANETTLQPSRTSLGDGITVPEDGTERGGLTVDMPRKRFSLPFQHTAVLQAENVIDPNPEPSTRFQLPFEPRTWGDLSVEFLEPEDAITESVPSLIPVEVTNDGLDRSPPTQLEVHVDGEVLTASVPSLPPAEREPRKASTTLFVPWTPETGTAGEHELTAIVDPEGDLDEYTRTDNEAVETFTVHPLRIPDLSFHEDELSLEGVDAELQAETEGTLETYTIPEGSLVRLSVPVENTGNSPATLVDVRLFYGSLALPAERIDRLAPGQTEEVSFTFLAADDTREISLEVTSGDRDLDPSDNAVPTDGRIRLQGLSFDVDVQAEPVHLDEPGQEAETPIELTNPTGVGVLVELAPDTPEGFSLKPAVEQVFLEPGQTEAVNATVATQPSAPGGTHELGLIVRDLDDASNEAHGQVPVTIEPHHDLQISTPAHRLEPGTTSVPVTLTNDGNLDERVRLQARLAGANLTEPVSVTVPRDVPRNLQLELTLPPGSPTGTQQLTIVANGTTTTELQRTVEVAKRAQLSVSIDPAGATLNPKGLSVPLHAHNVGTDTLTAALIPDPVQAPGGTFLEPERLQLAPAESRNVSLVTPATGSASEIPVTIDAAGVEDVDVPVPEANTDLVVLRQTITPENPKPGQPVELRATVANDGDSTARDVPVDLFIDEAFAARAQVEELKPGASRTITFEWPAFEGEHVASTVVDPDGRFPDLQPDNDRANLHVTAGDGGLLGQLLRVPSPAGLLVPLLALSALLVPRARSNQRGGES